MAVWFTDILCLRPISCSPHILVSANPISIAVLALSISWLLNHLYLHAQWIELTWIRQERGLTQEQLAEKIEASSRTIQRYEAGKSVPTTAYMAKLQQVLDYPLTHPKRNSSSVKRPIAAHQRPQLLIKPNPKWYEERRNR